MAIYKKKSAQDLDENEDPLGSNDSPEALEWYDALRKLLAPYEPAATMLEADKLFTTSEIRQALEMHYSEEQGIAGGDAETGPFINKIALVDQIEGLGFTFENTGDLQFHWLMKKKA
jgi:hypothetical protein